MPTKNAGQAPGAHYDKPITACFAIIPVPAETAAEDKLRNRPWIPKVKGIGASLRRIRGDGLRRARLRPKCRGACAGKSSRRERNYPRRPCGSKVCGAVRLAAHSTKFIMKNAGQAAGYFFSRESGKNSNDPGRCVGVVAPLSRRSAIL
jgi:hypothetical protein